jgi:hypothetical protein
MKIETKSITLAPMGAAEIVPPPPSVVYDIVSEWSASPSRAHIGRLTAAAIGVSAWRSVPGMPRYDVSSAKPIAYGGRVLDFLFAQGVDPNEIVVHGMQLLGELAPQLIRREEVQEKEDFTSAPLPAA